MTLKIPKVGSMDRRSFFLSDKALKNANIK